MDVLMTGVGETGFTMCVFLARGNITISQETIDAIKTDMISI